MDIRSIRKANLDRLVAEAGTVAALGRRADVNETYLRQVRRGIGGKGRVRPRALGDDVARKLEAGMGKPYGWMDQAHDHDALSAPAVGEFELEAAVRTRKEAPSVADLGAEYAVRRWPFSAALLDRVLALDTYQRGMIEGKLRAAIDECERENGAGARYGKQ